MDTEDAKATIKRIVLQHVPDAEVILYGSRARGDAASDSDWDLLILTPGDLSQQVEEQMRRALYEWEWEHDEVVTPIFRSKASWNSPLMAATPFHQNVMREGARL